MNIADYQDAVQRTCVTTDRDDTIKLALIGLQGELGEIADPLKKHLWHGHEVDLAHLQDEIGDVMWYLATLCTALISLSRKHSYTTWKSYSGAIQWVFHRSGVSTVPSGIMPSPRRAKGWTKNDQKRNETAPFT